MMMQKPDDQSKAELCREIRTGQPGSDESAELLNWHFRLKCLLRTLVKMVEWIERGTSDRPSFNRRVNVCWDGLGSEALFILSPQLIVM